MEKKKNPAAVALAKRRMETMTANERAEIARKGGLATRKKLTQEQRTEIARKAGLAGGRGRPKQTDPAPAASPARKKPPAAAPAARPKRSPAR